MGYHLANGGSPLPNLGNGEMTGDTGIRLREPQVVYFRSDHNLLARIGLLGNEGNARRLDVLIGLVRKDA